ncbi:hypothetical protein BpHYR1_030962 [Brachionus plicatilis]|uniref:Uncharacterized protein n=1 Tax=Brachionus plicatilis TaxID=10195 RepID=A0A3M7SWI2_BRAPC|nr:hypothetical protein BpHYR1_030962 [Brachionus plicatilis]
MSVQRKANRICIWDLSTGLDTNDAVLRAGCTWLIKISSALDVLTISLSIMAYKSSRVIGMPIDAKMMQKILPS